MELLPTLTQTLFAHAHGRSVEILNAAISYSGHSMTSPGGAAVLGPGRTGRRALRLATIPLALGYPSVASRCPQ
jgi:hypothetical protein